MKIQIRMYKMDEPMIKPECDLRRKTMNLKDKIYLRNLAFKSFNLYIEKFNLEDDDYIDYRAVRGKERALNNCIKKMSEITGVDEEKIYDIVVNSLAFPPKKSLDDLRDIGIPVATLKEIESYKKVNTRRSMTKAE